MTEIIISGTPVAKARPRGFKTKSGKLGFYTPAHSKNFEYLVRKRAEELFSQPLKKPIKIDILFLMPRPKNLYWKTRSMPRVPCTKRPDLDNLIKSVTDGLNKIAYNDDGQIAKINALKEYHSGDEGPKTIIRIEEYV